MNLNFILNPNAGSGRALEQMERIKNYLDSLDIAYSVFESKTSTDAQLIANKLINDKHRTLISVGGDGTISKLLPLIVEKNITYGIIPAGEGNDFARCLGISLDPIKAIDQILNYNIKNIDYVDVEVKDLNGKLIKKLPMCCFLCAGMEGIIERPLTDDSVVHVQKFSYIKAFFDAFKSKKYHFFVTINGDRKEYKNAQLTVMNGGEISTGLKLCPIADMSDGYIDVVIVKDASLNERIKMLREVASNDKNFLSNKNVEHYQVKELRIELVNHDYMDIDAEVYRGKIIDMKIKEKGLKVFS